MRIEWYSPVVGVAAAVLSSALAEFISWALVLRTDTYTSAVSRVAELRAKTDKYASDSSAKGKRKRAQYKSELEEAQRSIALSRIKANVAVAVVMVSLLAALGTACEGLVAAKLPFTPFGFVQSLSHRGLPGIDPTDCSVLFVYVLFSMAIKPNLQKILGTEQPKGFGVDWFNPNVPK
eukprot:m51a1_g8778 putative transmembrane and coiled-coil domains protein 1-like (178) ;mRNA; f:185019-185951